MSPGKARDFTALTATASRLRSAPAPTEDGPAAVGDDVAPPAEEAHGGGPHEHSDVTDGPPPDPAPARARRRPPPVQREPRRPGRPATGRASKGIGLPAALADEMAADAGRRGWSYGDWLMAALDAVWDELAGVFPPLPVYRPEIPAPRRTPRRRVDGGRVVVNFRLTPDQTAVLDSRAAELAVASRSEFVTEVVRLGLAGR